MVGLFDIANLASKSYATHRDQKLRVSSVILELHPEPTNVCVEGPGIGKVAIRPQAFEKFLASADDTWWGEQQRQKFELSPGKMHGHPSDGHDPT